MAKDNKGGSVTFDTLAEFYADFLKPQFDKLIALVQRNTEDIHELKTDVSELKTDLKVVKTDINELKTDMGYVKDEVQGLKADLSDTPSRKEFNALKEKAFA